MGEHTNRLLNGSAAASRSLMRGESSAAGRKAPSRAKPFDAEGSGFDQRSADANGMTRDEDGKFGSVVPAPTAAREKFGLPENSFLVLKGRAHPTFRETIKGEKARGSEVIKLGNRYFSVPANSVEDLLSDAPGPVLGE